ncbi:MAG: carbon storage regulator [Planctomycetales bacterium]
MLVLSRRTKERIVIDGCIEVTVLEVKGQRVKLGVAAPAEVSVSRPETMRRNEPPLRRRAVALH